MYSTVVRSEKDNIWMFVQWYWTFHIANCLNLTIYYIQCDCNKINEMDGLGFWKSKWDFTEIVQTNLIVCVQFQRQMLACFKLAIH